MHKRNGRHSLQLWTDDVQCRQVLDPGMMQVKCTKTTRMNSVSPARAFKDRICANSSVSVPIGKEQLETHEHKIITIQFTLKKD